MEALLALQVAAYVTAAAVGLIQSPPYQEWRAQQAEPDPPAVVETAEAGAPEITIVTD